MCSFFNLYLCGTLQIKLYIFKSVIYENVRNYDSDCFYGTDISYVEPSAAQLGRMH
ncbi:hypothetical protein ABWED_1240 [Acinetobacter lwoffii]|nr:hypothetical protein ABVS_0201 [Acinetobacter lwoffii]UVB00527.1 hypothetical protein ABWED_1240 [Acinetobacter lwoffii]